MRWMAEHALAAFVLWSALVFVVVLLWKAARMVGKRLRGVRRYHRAFCPACGEPTLASKRGKKLFCVICGQDVSMLMRK